MSDPEISTTVNIDVNKHREAEMALSGLAKADDVYTLYYDETNNHRLLRIGPGGLNVREPQCFVLGGIAHRGAPRELQFAELKQRLRLQATVKDMKLAHLGKGGFLDLLKSDKLLTFLEWIKEQGLFVHFHALDPFYFAFVDLVDSIIVAQGQPLLFSMAMPLKDTLFSLIRLDPEPVVELCRAYDYPSLATGSSAAFLRELWSILGRRREVIDPYWFQMLKGIVQMGMRQAELPFLTGEEPLVLMREYRSVYMNRLCLFKNSRHVLDDEGQIRPQMEAWRFMDGETQLAHFRFAISHDEPGVQISDPVAGLLGKFFSYLSSRNDAELETDKARLSIRQRSALTAMANLLNMSIEENEAFAGYVLPLTDQWRAASMLELDSSP
jgi:hypothetical protein